MLDQLKKFEEKRPEIVFEWKDAETDAEGWIVINSLRGGAAGGGTRMRKGLDKYEVTSLAKTMEIKFTVAGPQIGGAKSGINFDPSDPRKRGVLERWFKAVVPILKFYYGTGGDLNVDEVHDVIEITRRYGLYHPQEGVVNGHLGLDEKTKKERIHRLQEGVVLPVTDPALAPAGSRNFSVSDMITGYGVAESVRHHYLLQKEELAGKKVVIQGWGNVGAAAGYYLAFHGALISGIIDREGGLINHKGYDIAAVTQLFLNRDGNKLRADNMIPFEEINKSIWSSGADIFIPAAASRLVTRDHLDEMVENGLKVIACGANVPFADPEIFFGPTATYADLQVSLIPDFISNCGMARVFAFLMTSEKEVTDKLIFSDVSETIGNALAEVHQRQPGKTRLAETAFTIALEKLN
ncbi:MAG TPA: Glu/Leu/Phe/Val dehydrogenase dimerization domain-containing protein [Bacteroidia bacterium]|nr:Glu/Leu/Phe/Val dehydrogenase dimerization domain-containing protein [Bacteroidia bacterium]